MLLPRSLTLPLSLTLLGIRGGLTPAALDGLTKQAIRMHSGTARTACNASIITKADLEQQIVCDEANLNPNLKLLHRLSI